MSLETLRGEIVSLRLYDRGFAIAKVRDVRGALHTVVGQACGVSEGDHVDIEGERTEHPKYGPQLKAKTMSVAVPEDASGVVSWIASRCPGIGPVRARELVERFGVAELWRVLEQEPARLCEVKGITEERSREIAAAYAAHRGERDRMVFFRRFGLTDYQIGAIVAAWGTEAEERLKSDPYSVIDHVDGFGFKKADALAQRLGVKRDAPGRIRAAIFFLLDDASHAGHVYVGQGRLIAMAADLLELTEEDVAREAFPLFARESRLRVESKRVYLARLAEAETRVAAAALKMAKGATRAA